MKQKRKWEKRLALAMLACLAAVSFGCRSAEDTVPQTPDPLVRIQVEGEVRDPGTYRVEPDTAILNLMQTAGGYEPTRFTTAKQPRSFSIVTRHGTEGPRIINYTYAEVIAGTIEPPIWHDGDRLLVNGAFQR